jgi:hypothetical protein
MSSLRDFDLSLLNFYNNISLSGLKAQLECVPVLNRNLCSARMLPNGMLMKGLVIKFFSTGNEFNNRTSSQR